MPHVGRYARHFTFFFLIVIALTFVSCTKTTPPPKAPPSKPSDIKVEVKDGGPVIVTTTAAEFQILPSGFLQATLRQDGKRLTLDEPNVGSTGGSDSIVSHGKEFDFIPDFSQTKVLEASGKLGRGKRVEIPARPLAPSGVPIDRMLVLETYDDFPGIALVSATYKNVGTSDFHVDNVLMQQHRFNAQQVDSKVQPWDMWSFQGSSYDWGKDDVQKMVRTSSQPNVMGEAVKGGYGGGIPVVALWTGSVGEAIGHVETVPWTLSMPLKVDPDGRVNAMISIPINLDLKPGESYSSPRSFVAAYSGDFYEPLRTWSSVLQKEGWDIPKPSNEAYNVSWCGWGYEFNVTPKQMLGTVPKLKEMGIKWATLDDR
jgi:alpha-galactosidase